MTDASRPTFRSDRESAAIELPDYALPTPAIRRTSDALHTNAVVIRIAPWVARNDNDVARFERFTRHAVAAQLTASAPLDGPGLHHALVVWSFHVDERMGIPVQELYQLALNRDLLILEIGGCK